MFDSSPRLIAAIHVFLRLLTPRHPPYALNSLTIPLFFNQVFNWSARRSYRHFIHCIPIGCIAPVIRKLTRRYIPAKPSVDAADSLPYIFPMRFSKSRSSQPELVYVTSSSVVFMMVFIPSRIISIHRRASERIGLDVTPDMLMVEVNGIEPMTSCVQGRRSPN